MLGVIVPKPSLYYSGPKVQAVGHHRCAQDTARLIQTLLFDQSGLRVATVGPGDKVVLKKVTISRDLGKEIDIGSGLASDDRVIASPPDGLANGDAVKISKDTREATETDAPPPGKPKS